MTPEEAANELKNYHREDGTVPEEIMLAIQALETGEVYMTGEDYNLYMEGYKAGKKDFEPKQGEWKRIYTGLTYKYQCSLCGRTISPMYSPMLLADYPFCHCGADMRKGGAK